MGKSEKTDPLREDRIIMQIVADAYGPNERAMGWYCYLENNLTFPFTARCTSRRAISPLKLKDKVEVIGMADSEECVREMFVSIRRQGRGPRQWEDDELAVALSQLKVVDGDEQTHEAVEDWCYWVSQGYQF